MQFDTWSTPFEHGTIFLVDLSWGAKTWTLEKADGTKYEIKGNDKLDNVDLVARVFHLESEMLYEIAFGIVNGHRCLDEHGLTEIWSSNPPQTNTYKIKGHSWHNESPLSFFMGNDNEWSYLIVTGDECLEVICRNEPSVGVVGKIAPRFDWVSEEFPQIKI